MLLLNFSTNLFDYFHNLPITDRHVTDRVLSSSSFKDTPVTARGTEKYFDRSEDCCQKIFCCETD